MATYVNDLRLKEISTGDESGTWGTSTNTNLELIGEALGYATQQVFSSDADATTTVADGASDPARAMYFKITSAGSLTATRTCTIAPNTVSRVMFIENATTGSQSIAISQGSGANVTIATGKTAVVYLDGAGSGAAVVDAMAGVDPGVTDTLTEVLVAGNTSGGTNIELTTTDKVQFRDSAIYINSSADGQLDLVADTEIQIAATTIDVNGTLAFDSLKGTGATTVTNILDEDNMASDSATAIATQQSIKAYVDSQVGSFDTLAEVLAQGNTTGGTDIAVGTGDDITFADSSKAIFGAGSDLQIYHDGSNSYVEDTGTGSLIVEGTNLVLRADDGSRYLQGVDGASGVTRLYHPVDDAIKLETTSTGIDVTGTATMGGLTVSNTDGSIVKLESTGTGLGAGAVIGDLQFYGNDASVPGAGIKASITATTVAALGDDSQLMFSTSNGTTNNVNRMLIANNGDISFYDDAAAQGLFWDSSASALGLGTTIPGQKLEIKESSAGAGDAIIRLRGDGNNANNTPLGSLEWFNTDASGPQPGVVAAVEAQSANSNGHMGKLLFKTHDGSGSEADPPTTRMTIDQSGKVGIGISSPLGQLHINTETAEATKVYVDGEANQPKSIEIRHYDTSEGSGAGRNLFYLKTPASDRLDIGNFTDGSSEAQLMTFLESGNVGIGTVSPARKLTIQGGAGDTLPVRVIGGSGATTGGIEFQDPTTTADYKVQVGSIGDNLYLRAGGAERMRIDSSGNVGIGTASPGRLLELYGTTNPALRLHNGTDTTDIGIATSAGAIATSSLNGALVIARNGANAINLATNGNVRATIDSSGNVGIGGTPDTALTVFGGGVAEFRVGNIGPSNNSAIRVSRNDTSVTSGNPLGYLEFGGNDSTSNLDTSFAYVGAEASGAHAAGDNPTDLVFGTTADNTAAPTERMRIDGSGLVGIGSTTMSSYNTNFNDLVVDGGTNSGVTIVSGTSGDGTIAFADGTTGNEQYRGYIQYTHSGDDLKFGAAGTEAMRIDSSGKLLIGTTHNSLYNSSTQAHAGALIDGVNDNIQVARWESTPLFVNRMSTDGNLVDFRKDGAAVGIIGTVSGGLSIGSGDTGLYFESTSNEIRPFDTTANASIDAAIDLGNSTKRFKDLYLSGTANIGLAKLTNSNTTSGYFMSIDAEGTEAGQKMTHYWYDGSYHNRFTVAGNSAETIFNESSEDIDFRVESDGATHMLFVDASTNRVGINTSSPSNTFHSVSANANMAKLVGSGSGDVAYVSFLNDATSAVGNGAGLEFRAHTATNERQQAFIQTGWTDTTDATRTSTFVINQTIAGAGREIIDSTGDAGMVINQSGIDYDFRVETDATANGFVVNAGVGIVGIGRDNVWSFSTNTTPGFAVNVTSGRVDVSADSVARITQINDATGTFDRFYGAGSIVGSITTDGSNTAFNTSSDQRLKENIVDAPSASDDIDAIQVRSFNWKADGVHQKYGMIAQELQTVAPEAVHQPEDSEYMMGVDYSKLVPMLIKEIQSLRARVSDLES